jgi:hypothetical protein
MRQPLSTYLNVWCLEDFLNSSFYITHANNTVSYKYGDPCLMDYIQTQNQV